MVRVVLVIRSSMRTKKKKKVVRSKIFSIKFSETEFQQLKKLSRERGHGMVSRLIREVLFG